ncbi:MAG: hypothetical protein AB7O57_17585 [Hyphomicrobiaceae bacterium]
MRTKIVGATLALALGASVAMAQSSGGGGSSGGSGGSSGGAASTSGSSRGSGGVTGAGPAGTPSPSAGSAGSSTTGNLTSGPPIGSPATRAPGTGVPGERGAPPLPAAEGTAVDRTPGAIGGPRDRIGTDSTNVLGSGGVVGGNSAATGAASGGLGAGATQPVVPPTQLECSRGWDSQSRWSQAELSRYCQR